MIAGVLLGAMGCGVIVAAASLVSVALAVFAAGVFLVFGGIITVYAATVLEGRAGQIFPATAAGPPSPADPSPRRSVATLRHANEALPARSGAALTRNSRIEAGASRDRGEG